MNSSRKSTLPPHFIGAMRTLFDIMDVDRSGTIRLDELTRRWERNPPDPATGIPPSFIPCLKKVTPSNGLLTFERFCAGLRLALAEHRLDQQAKNYPHKMHHHYANPPLSQKVKSDTSLNVSASRDTERMSTRRRVEERRATGLGVGGSQPAIHHLPAQEPIYGNYQLNGNHESIYQRRNSLHNNSQRRVKARAPAPPPYGMLSVSGVREMPPKPLRQAVPPPPQPRHSIPAMLDGPSPPRVAAFSTSSSSASSNSTEPYATTVESSPTEVAGIRWRDRNGLTVITDGRRHTLADGDSALRHQRMMSEEEELLERGLGTANKLSNWLHSRQANLRTRAKLLGKSSIPVDSAVHEEKLNFLRAHISELGRRVNDVVESSDRGFPSALNNRPASQAQDSDQLAWLKKQNQQLTEEVSRATSQLRRLDMVRLGSKSPSPLSSATPSPPSLGFRSSHYAQPTPLLYAAPFAQARRPPQPIRPDPLSGLDHDYQATLI